MRLGGIKHVNAIYKLTDPTGQAHIHPPFPPVLPPYVLHRYVTTRDDIHTHKGLGGLWCGVPDLFSHALRPCPLLLKKTFP